MFSRQFKQERYLKLNMIHGVFLRGGSWGLEPLSKEGNFAMSCVFLRSSVRVFFYYFYFFSACVKGIYGVCLTCDLTVMYLIIDD